MRELRSASSMFTRFTGRNPVPGQRFAGALSFTHFAGSDRHTESTMDLRAYTLKLPLVIALLVMGSAVAQPRIATAVAPFTGTLQKIYETGVIRIGHRENSPPFAFLDAQRRSRRSSAASR